MQIPHQKQTGFSLIELLVIIAIIGILSSILVANINDARANARDTTIRQTARNIATMFDIEYSSNGQHTNHQYGWVRPGTDPCSAQGFRGEFATELRTACENILNNTNYPDGTTVMHWGIDTNSFSPSQSYSIMIRMNNGNFHCVGTNGKSYEGPINPGTGNWTGSGCWRNP